MVLLEKIKKRDQVDQIRIDIDRKARRNEVAIAPEWLESILNSLIDNAHKHGGDNVELTILCKQLAGPKRSMQIQVSNKGQGISDSTAKKIFDPCFTTARETGSSGLGLTIVQALVKSYGGFISLSRSKSTTTFQIVLPVR